MKRCKNCGSLIDDEVKFCMYCGSRIEDEPKEEEYISDEGEKEYTICPHCQSYMDKYDRFCPRCGMENEKYSGEAKNYDSFYRDTIYMEASKERAKNPFECYASFWKRTFDFKGRSTRGEFWWPYLFNFILTDIISTIADLVPQNEVLLMNFPEYGIEGIQIGSISLLVSIILEIVLLIPSLASLIRRLRDTGKSPFCIFMAFIPLVGPFIILCYLIQKTDRYKM